jgi:hypothetical protein
MFRFWESEDGKPAVSTASSGAGSDVAVVLRKGFWSDLNVASLRRNGEALSEPAWRKRFAAELHSAPDFAKAFAPCAVASRVPPARQAAHWRVTDLARAVMNDDVHLVLISNGVALFVCSWVMLGTVWIGEALFNLRFRRADVVLGAFVLFLVVQAWAIAAGLKERRQREPRNLTEKELSALAKDLGGSMAQSINKNSEANKPTR